MVDLIPTSNSNTLVPFAPTELAGTNNLALDIKQGLTSLENVLAGRSDIEINEALRDAMQLDLETRGDGILANALLELGQGSQIDVENYSRPERGCPLSPDELGWLFATDSLCARVCNFYPQEMAKGGYTVEGGVFGDEVLGKKYSRWLRRYKFIDKLKKATILADIYNRGSGILLNVDDGQRFDQPVNMGAVKSVQPLYAKDGWELSPVHGFNAEPYAFSLNIRGLGSEIDGQRDQLLKMPNGSALVKRLEEGSTSHIHPDRVLWFPGIWVPNRIERQMVGSPSRLEMFWRHYSRLELGMSIAINLMARISVVHVQQDGWLELVSKQTPESHRQITEQLELLKYQMHNLGIVISDKQSNDVSIVQRSLSGVADILDRLENRALAAAEMSKLDLFGVTDGSGTMPNDSIERVTRANTVERRQKDQWLEHVEKITAYWLASEGKPELQDDDEDWAVVFPTTLALTEAERMASMSQKVNAAANAKQSGFIHADEGRAMLAADPVWAPFIDLAREAPPDPAAQALDPNGAPVGGDDFSQDEPLDDDVEGGAGDPSEDDVDENEIFPDL